MDYSQVDLF